MEASKPLPINRENIILIGLRGSGKTTVGKLLSERLSYSFLDMDIEIQKQLGKDIARIVSEHGWGFFREKEHDILHSLSLSRTVFSTGGGVILDPRNREWIQHNGWVVWLDVSPETSWERIRNDNSRPPLITNQDSLQEIKIVHAEREPLYRGISHWKISTRAKTPEEIAHAIYTAYRSL